MHETCVGLHHFRPPTSAVSADVRELGRTNGRNRLLMRHALTVSISLAISGRLEGSRLEPLCASLSKVTPRPFARDLHGEKHIRFSECRFKRFASFCTCAKGRVDKPCILIETHPRIVRFDFLDYAISYDWRGWQLKLIPDQENHVSATENLKLTHLSSIPAIAHQTEERLPTHFPRPFERYSRRAAYISRARFAQEPCARQLAGGG